MISALPAVQAKICHARRIVWHSASNSRYKREANRRFRHVFNAKVRLLQDEPERWYDEVFDAPSLSTWDLW